MTDIEPGERDVPLDKLPRPIWMEVLLQKYVMDKNGNCSSDCNTAILPTLGELACYLSCCLTRQISCTSKEEYYLFEVGLMTI